MLITVIIFDFGCMIWKTLYCCFDSAMVSAFGWKQPWPIGQCQPVILILHQVGVKTAVWYSICMELFINKSNRFVDTVTFFYRPYSDAPLVAGALANLLFIDCCCYRCCSYHVHSIVRDVAEVLSVSTKQCQHGLLLPMASIRISTYSSYR